MQKRFLHVGCGRARQDQALGFEDRSEWEEIRLDIEESVSPDVLGTLTDLRAIESESIDAIYSSHNLEHIFPWEVPIALGEFQRVLKPDGFIVVTCPDLQEICALIAKGGLEKTLYISNAGAVRPMDMLYGFQPAIKAGEIHMAHKGGFTQQTLNDAVIRAGFKMVYTHRDIPGMILWSVGTKGKRSPADFQQLTASHFPK